MATASEARSSRLILDQEWKVLPFFNNIVPGAPVFVHASGLLDLVNVVAQQAGLYFPFNAKILGAYSRVRTQLGTGPGVAALGIIGTLTKFGTQSHPISASAGTEYVWTMASDLNINKGDVLVFSGDGGATSTGDVDVVTFWQPRI